MVMPLPKVLSWSFVCHVRFVIELMGILYTELNQESGEFSDFFETQGSGGNDMNGRNIFIRRHHALRPPPSCSETLSPALTGP